MIVEDLVLRLRGLVDPDVDKIKKSATEAAAAVAAMAAALAALTVASAQAVREQTRLAEGLGETVQTVQELGFAFRRFGADEADVADALATIADRAEDAKGGMQSFIDDFALVGVAVDDLRDKSPAELFETFIKGASETADANKRVTAAVRVFGDDLGRKLLPLLTRGTSELDALKAEARDLGLVLDDATAAAAEDLSDGLDALTARVGGLVTGLGLRLIPTGQILVREFGRLLDVIQPLISRGFDLLASSIERAAAALETPAGRIVAVLAGGAASVGIAGAMTKAVAAVPVFGTAMAGLAVKLSALATPAAVVAALALAVNDLNAAAEGEASLTGTLADRLGLGDETQDALKGIKTLLVEVADSFGFLARAVADAVADMIPEFEWIEDAQRGLIRFSRAVRAIGRYTLESTAEATTSAARGFNLAARYAAGEAGVQMVPDALGAGGVTGAVVGAAMEARSQALSTSAISPLDTLPPVSVTVSTGPSRDEIARAAGAEVERQVRSALVESGG